jgi:hypothetical protein
MAMSDSEHTTTLIKKRLDAYDRQSDVLLSMLQQVCERRPKTKFDKDKARAHLRFVAFCHLNKNIDADKTHVQATAENRDVKLLSHLDALCVASRKVKEAMQNARGPVFVEWCIAHGDPDFLDPSISVFEREFDRITADVIAGLAILETAASRATEDVRERIRQDVRLAGRPSGSTLVPHGLILGLERVYRESTGKSAGAGAGPFARFVSRFLEVAGRKMMEQSVVEAIKAAKKREEKNPATSKWGRRQLSLADILKSSAAKR